jgi:hypothetical protein
MSNHTIMSLRWLAPMALVGALGLAACGGDGPPDVGEIGASNRAAQAHQGERYVELQKDRGSRVCKWISVGAPPRPESVAVLEHCDGEWTGSTEWVQPRSSGSRRAVERRVASSHDG